MGPYHGLVKERRTKSAEGIFHSFSTLNGKWQLQLQQPSSEHKKKKNNSIVEILVLKLQNQQINPNSYYINSKFPICDEQILIYIT
jgi:hypothetical protein